jgi:CBS domain-containing protein
MNIAFFLIPKKDVAYLQTPCTMRQALEKMEFHRYTAVPIIDSNGKYHGTISEGDLLRHLKNTPGLSFEGMKKVSLESIPVRSNYQPVRIHEEIESLLSLVLVQNFVPVVDDSDTFIGIIRRREILEHFFGEIFKNTYRTEAVQAKDAI